MNKISPFRFKPLKQFIFTSKPKDNFATIQPYKIKPIPKQQKIFNTISPVKPFTRFIKPKIYGTGSDPSMAFINFMNKDCEKPYKKMISPIITQGFKNKPIKNIRWSLGTTCNCNNKDYLPKLDPFKEYNFYSRNNKIKNSYTTAYLSTDHISIRNPEFKTLEVDGEKNYKFFNMKKKYNPNSESESYWVPFAFNNDNNNFNRSSVPYNIINNKDNKISGKKEISIIEKTINNKKKGVAEFYHLQRNYEPNYSPKFSKYIDKYKKGFLKYKGVFTNLYDSYNKNGNIYQPFSIDNNPISRNKKKLNIVI